MRNREGDFYGAREKQRDKWPEIVAFGGDGWSCVDAAEKLRPDLFEIWKQPKTLAVAALTLTAPKGALDDEHRVAERLIATGIPVAFWLTEHAGATPEAMEKLMERLKGQVANLPYSVRTWNEEDNTLLQCSGISLLWDNVDDPLPDLITETLDDPNS